MRAVLTPDPSARQTDQTDPTRPDAAQQTGPPARMSANAIDPSARAPFTEEHDYFKLYSALRHIHTTQRKVGLPI